MNTNIKINIDCFSHPLFNADLTIELKSDQDTFLFYKKITHLESFSRKRMVILMQKEPHIHY
ncbi:MAG: hypothetical protein Q8K60_02490 [Parachlamydiaceae bacterium]|nr:hypothetical protein [Parachlamydiaceae bacterium]